MDLQGIVPIILRLHPKVEGIYLFGTFGSLMESPESDVDIALLLPLLEARKTKSLAFSACHEALESFAKRSVDLINLREANTVFQNEIISEGRLIFAADEAAIDSFEMHVMSAYQKLNEERAEILNDIEISGRIFQ